MSQTLDNGQIVLTLEEAVARLPKGNRIHTFLQAGPVLVGAHWTRAQVMALLKEAAAREDPHRQIQETGDEAQSVGHGIAAEDEVHGNVFIEARGPWEHLTSGGVPLTQEVISKAAAEAEAGYDPAKLRPRSK